MSRIVQDYSNTNIRSIEPEYQGTLERLSITNNDLLQMRDRLFDSVVRQLALFEFHNTSDSTNSFPVPADDQMKEKIASSAVNDFAPMRHDGKNTHALICDALGLESVDPNMHDQQATKVLKENISQAIVQNLLANIDFKKPLHLNIEKFNASKKSWELELEKYHSEKIVGAHPELNIVLDTKKSHATGPRLSDR